MNRPHWLFHPILIFVFSVIALATSLALYIYWYVEVSAGLQAVVRKFNLDPTQFLELKTWVVVLVLCLLVGIILVGIFIIFVYYQKTVQLYRMQHNFINNFTHELKTPVTSLQLFLETLSKYELSRSDQLRYINYMIQDVSRLTDNINRILNLARIESKGFRGEFIRSDLVQVVEGFCQNNRHLFGDSRISVDNPSGRTYYYRINPSLFEMLLMNLVTNAIKYNAAEGARIDIRFVPQKKHLHICFEDNGIGIEKAKIKKIFKKFYQIGRATDMSAKGSGLGLHLVQNIARIHSGRVTAASRGPNQGSVFTLALPNKDLVQGWPGAMDAVQEQSFC